MNRQQHWEAVYETKAADTVSWYRPHLDSSLALIERAAPDRDAAVLDVGGGASTLVDDLLARGYRDLSVLDISAEALRVARERLGKAAEAVNWLAVDLLDAPLQEARYNLWHDRAVFHFLTEAGQRANYVRQLPDMRRPVSSRMLRCWVAIRSWTWMSPPISRGCRCSTATRSCTWITASWCYLIARE